MQREEREREREREEGGEGGINQEDRKGKYGERDRKRWGRDF
jgi:hypothetical protein